MQGKFQLLLSKLRLKSDASFFALLQVEILIGLAAVCAIHGLNPGLAVLYFTFQLFSIFIPGMAALSLLRFKFPSGIALAAFSYAIGIAIALCEYMMCTGLGIRDALVPVNLLIVAIALVVIVLGRADILQFECRVTGWVVCLVLFPFVLTIGIITVSCCNSLPSEVGDTGYYVDWPFWVGNNISLMKDFPATNFRLYGTPFRYHYFSSILVAYESLVTGIDCVLLSFYYSYFIPGVMLVLSGIAFFESFIKKGYLRLIAVLVMLFTGGTTITYEWHLYFCPFGFDYGYIFGILAVTTIVYMIKDASVRLIALSSVLLAVCTGCKGPVGMVALSGFGVFTVYLLAKKKWKQGLIGGLAWLGSFALIFFAFIYASDATIGGTATATNGSGLQLLGVGRAFQQNPYTQQILQEFSWMSFLPRKMLLAYCLGVYVIRTNPAAITLLAIAVIHLCALALKRLHIVFESVLFLVISLFGITLTITTYQSGGSQMYFVTAVIPFCIAAGIKSLDLAAEGTSVDLQRLSFSNACLAVVLVSFGVGHFAFYNQVHGKMVEGIQCLEGTSNETKWAHYVNPSEYEAFIWLRDNTPDNCLIAQDVFENSSGVSTDMVSGVFSERFIWNDGKYASPDEEINRRKQLAIRAFNGEEVSIEELKQEGVSYLLQMDSSAEDIPESDAIYCVYQHGGQRIYEIK